MENIKPMEMKDILGLQDTIYHYEVCKVNNFKIILDFI